MRKSCIFIMIFILLFTGCLPTPTEEVVIHKNEGTLEQQISATAAPAYRIEIPVETPGEGAPPAAATAAEATPVESGLREAVGAPEIEVTVA